MKMSVSLPDEDVEFLEAYAKEKGIRSRSAVVQKALRLLRALELERDYEEAWGEWSDSELGADWDAVSDSGVS